jgi:hypothetical protein
MKFVEASFFTSTTLAPVGAYIFDADNPRERIAFEERQRYAMRDNLVVAVAPLPSGTRIVAKRKDQGWMRQQIRMRA